ncbi:MAG TPA: Gfo/Idh/MocA family oxidoreductase [Armatimonadota bacterium]|jgi:predicted dehydrogenase
MIEPVRWGVLGTAKFAMNRWLPSFVTAPDVRGVAIASRDAEKARAACEQFGFERSYGSYDELLADPDVEAVYIPLPNGLHGEWALKAIAAGKHVLSEKPAWKDAAEARAVVDAARAAGVRVMEGFMTRHHARWKRVRQRIDAGDIGVPKLFTGAFCFTLDDAANARWNPSLAGGALADVGSYCVNAARLCFGAEPTHAWGLSEDTRGTGVDSTFSGGLRFPTGHATFVCSFETAFQQSAAIVGTEGSIALNRPFICREEPVLLTLTSAHGDPTEERLPVGDQYVDTLNHLNACIRDMAKPLWPGEDGLASALVLDALRASARSGVVAPI